MTIVPRLLVVAALVAAFGSAGAASSAPGSAEWRSNTFRSPTGNIRCRYWPGDALLGCTTLNNGRVAAVRVFGRPYVDSNRNYTFPSGPVLTYGDYWSVRGRFRCDSRFNGMTCRSLRTGAGFFINRTSYRLF